MPLITRQSILEFIQQHRYAVLATVSPAHAPEAALVGFAVAEDFTIIFDAIKTTRKCQNLLHNPRIAFVIGWQDDRTLQYEGTADMPEGRELDETKRIYCSRWPEAPARDIWPGHIYVRVKPRWIRFSSYTLPYQIEEFEF